MKADVDKAFGRALGGRGFGARGAGAPALPMAVPPRALRDGEIQLGQASNGDAIGLDLVKLIEGRLLIQGNSGAGKSMLLRRLFEQAFGLVQQLLIDPDGEFATLAEKFDVVVIGAAEILRVGGEVFARHIREHRYSAVLDLSDATSEQRLSIVADLASGLVEAPQEHWHPMLVLVDETQTLVPRYDPGDVEPETRKRTIRALADLMGRGRKRGLAGVIATGRIAETSTPVVSKATNIIVGRTIFDRDLERAGAVLGFTAGASRPLRTLKDGEFICIGPAIGGPTRLRFKAGPVVSRHKGDAPAIKAPPAISAAAAAGMLRQVPGAAIDTEHGDIPVSRRTGKPVRGWTAREDAIISKGYADKLSVREVAAALEKAGCRRRSTSGVSARAHDMGLVSFKAANQWSEAEDEILRDCYTREVRMMDIVGILAKAGYERGLVSVQMRAIALGITRDRVNYWTEAEKQIAVAGLTAGKPYREVLQDLRDAGFERGTTSLFKFAQKHNFNRGADSWSAEDIEILRQRYADKVGCKEIANELNKTDAAVRTYACKLGLKQRVGWSDSEQALLIKACKAGDTLVSAAAKIGRPYVNVARMAAVLKLSFQKTVHGSAKPKKKKGRR